MSGDYKQTKNGHVIWSCTSCRDNKGISLHWKSGKFG